MRGIPVYTQHTVAWQDRVPMRDQSMIEDINVSFSAKGGGTWGEFSFVWYDFGKMWPGDKRDHRAMKVSAFTNGGMSAMLDRRILPIIERLSRRKNDAPEIEPAKLVEMLEEAGVRPSEHHLRGLYEGTWGRLDFWPKEAQRACKALMRHEEGG